MEDGEDGICCAKEMKCILNWIDPWICYQTPNNLIIITDLVFVWPLSPVKTDSTRWGRQRTRSPYCINKTRPVKPSIQVIQAASTTNFAILALGITGFRFCSWEALLCLESASKEPLPFTWSGLRQPWEHPVCVCQEHPSGMPCTTTSHYSCQGWNWVLAQLHRQSRVSSGQLQGQTPPTQGQSPSHKSHACLLFKTKRSCT